MPETTKPALPTSEPEAERLREQAFGWLRRLTSGEMTEADVRAFDRWRANGPAHRRAFAEANLLWDTLEPVARAGRAQVDAAPILPPHMLARPLGRRALLGGATATVLGGVAYLAVRPPMQLWPALSEMAADYRTGVGERRQLPLQAGISVEMNTRTSLSGVHENGAGTSLELVAGQVAIAVEEGAPQPVVIAAGSGEARASRAQFDVRKDGDTVCVTCSQGIVDVTVTSATVTLLSGQQVVYEAQELGTVVTIDVSVATAWQRGLLIFRDAPLALVVDEVNRYRPGRIILLNSALAERRVVAGFRLDRIDDVVGYFTRVFGARARTLPGGVVLLS